jgi:hypothetical protein
MELTKHAEKRKKQRGFSSFSLEILENFGDVRKASGGMTKVFFGKREYQRTVQEFKKAIQLLDKAKGCNLIIDGDQIITVYK